MTNKETVLKDIDFTINYYRKEQKKNRDINLTEDLIREIERLKDKVDYYWRTEK